MTTEVKSPLWNERQAAEFLHMSFKTLQRWRCQGLGPDYVKLGNKVFYQKEVLERYIKTHTVKAVG